METRRTSKYLNLVSKINFREDGPQIYLSRKTRKNKRPALVQLPDQLWCGCVGRLEDQERQPD